MVIIPVQPSPYDVWAAKEIIDLVTEVRVIKEHLKAVVCLRVGFAESAAGGQTVLETEPHGHAAQEIRALTEEIKEHLNEQQNGQHQSQPAKQAAGRG